MLKAVVLWKEELIGQASCGWKNWCWTNRGVIPHGLWTVCFHNEACSTNYLWKKLWGRQIIGLIRNQTADMTYLTMKFEYFNFLTGRPWQFFCSVSFLMKLYLRTDRFHPFHKLVFIATVFALLRLILIKGIKISVSETIADFVCDFSQTVSHISAMQC